MSMDKVWKRLEDMNVMSLVVYGNTTDGNLYYESAYTNQVTQEDATAAFERNMLLVKDSTTTLIPVAMDGATISTISCADGTVTGTTWSVKASA